MWLRGQSVRRRSSRKASPSPHTPSRDADPAPITLRQLRVLARSAGRELTWGLPTVSHEVRRWRDKAQQIPDQAIRADALSALHRKRGQTDGAALFSILPESRNTPLLRVLVAYQVIWDFLDSVHERAATVENGIQLHTALVDAMDPSQAPRDYYRHHPWKDDGGYLHELIRVCQENCVQLPGFPAVAPLVALEARRAEVLALNHELDAKARDDSLQAWAKREFPDGTLPWWELSGAASAGLTIFALLALAADDTTTAALLARTRSVYFPWTSVAATMLDSYVDRAEDEATGDHSYVAHYLTSKLAIERIGQLVHRSIRDSRMLPNGEAHTLIVACMVAMYLTKDAARSSAMRAHTAQIARSGGSLTRRLIPVLRLWRLAYSQRAA